MIDCKEQNKEQTPPPPKKKIYINKEVQQAQDTLNS